MAKAWGAGAWAADAEEAEKEAEQGIPIGKNADNQAFPSLGEAVAAAPKKKKDKKQTMSLSEMLTGTYVGPGGRARKAAAGGEVGYDVIMSLPKGPRERGPEEEGGDGLGGAFRDYGGFRGGDRGDRRDDERKGRRGFDNDDEDAGMPSRADTEDDWGKSRKFVPSSGGPPSRGRDDSRERGPSAADEEGTWSKKFVPSGDRPREGGFEKRGGGFSDRYEDDRRAGGFDGGSKADEVDNWGKEKKFVPSSGGSRGFGGGGGGFGGGGGSSESGDRWGRREEAPAASAVSRPSERPRLALQKRSVPVEAPAGEKKEEEVTENGEAKPAPPKPRSNPFGAARPREDILQAKGQDWKKIDVELEKKTKAGLTPSGSTSGGSSRGSSPPPAAKPKPKSNPFGAARPREQVLQEKGVDFRKADLELEQKRLLREETPEEAALKKEIEELRVKLQAVGKPAAGEGDEAEKKEENGDHADKDVEAELEKKEKELGDLIRKLNDKVRFSKASDKPSKERDWRDAKAQAPPPAPKPAPKETDAGKVANSPSAASPADVSTKPADGGRSFADISRRPAALDTKNEGPKRDAGAVSPAVAKESPKVKKPEVVKKAVTAEPTIVKGGFGALQEDDGGDVDEEEEGGEKREESHVAPPKPEEAAEPKPASQDSGRGWEQVVKGSGKR